MTACDNSSSHEKVSEECQTVAPAAEGEQQRVCVHVYISVCIAFLIFAVDDLFTYSQCFGLFKEKKIYRKHLPLQTVAFPLSGEPPILFKNKSLHCWNTPMYVKFTCLAKNTDLLLP